MNDNGLARGAAWTTLLIAASVVALLLVTLIPWDHGPITDVAPGDVFTPDQLSRAEDFAGTARLIGWGSFLVSLLVAGGLGFTSLGARVVAAMPRRLRLPLGVVAVLLIGRLATLPLSLVSRNERLEYGLSRQPLSGWFRDYATSIAVSWVVITLGLGLLIWVARRNPRWWFAWVGAGAAALTFVLSFLYPVLVEPLFNRFTPMADGSLRTSIMQLAQEEGVPVEDVLVADASRRTTTLNAYVSGFGSTRRVVVYDNLVSDLPPDQVLIVVAHELAHAKHDDVLIGTTIGAVSAIGAVAMLSLILDSRPARRRAGVAGPGDVRVIALVLALTTFGGLVASPVQNSASRAIEARADRDSLQVTQDPETFEIMQRQLAITSLSDPTPPEWSHFWFGSHPTTLQRIGMARALR